jgi:hypothetical protein
MNAVSTCRLGLAAAGRLAKPSRRGLRAPRPRRKQHTESCKSDEDPVAVLKDYEYKDGLVRVRELRVRSAGPAGV